MRLIRDHVSYIHVWLVHPWDSAIWVLAAVTIGGGVMGMPGMLLGVPLAATLYRLLQEDIRRTNKGDSVGNN